MKWISVYNKMPDPGQRVIASNPGKYDYKICIYWVDRGSVPHFGRDDPEEAKYWMPLPEVIKDEFI
jgi:hypothetical protein